MHELRAKALELLQASLCQSLLLRRTLVCGLQRWIRHAAFLLELLVEIFQDSCPSLSILLSRVVILIHVVKFDETFVRALRIIRGLQVHVKVDLLCLTSSMVTLTLRILI